MSYDGLILGGLLMLLGVVLLVYYCRNPSRLTTTADLLKRQDTAAKIEAILEQHKEVGK